MVCKWSLPITLLIEDAPCDWGGLWSLISTAGHGALTLSLSLPLGAGVDLAFCGIDLGEAREELEWVCPELARMVSLRLGPLSASDDLHLALDLVAELVEAAWVRARALADEHASVTELSALRRALGKLHAASDEFARAVV